MPHDAFGNKVSEDPLAGLGSGAAGSHRPGMPGGRRPRRGRGILVLVLAVVVIGVAAGIFVLAAGSGDDPSPPAAPTAVAEEPVAEKPSTEEPAEPDPEPEPEKPAAAEPTAPPTGLQRGSLLRRANFTVALRRLRAEAKGRPRNVRVEALRVDVQVVLNDGRLRSAQASWDGEVRVFSTTPTPIGGLEGFAWSQIDRGAPQRLVRSATGRAKKPASAFNYAVMLDIGGPRWSAFLKSGEAFTASGSGRIERQISG